MDQLQPSSTPSLSPGSAWNYTGQATEHAKLDKNNGATFV